MQLRPVDEGVKNYSVSKVKWQVYYYLNDHLGTPQELFDKNGKLVWQARTSPYGEILKLGTNLIENPIRLPGQYEDSETRLYYNRFRYYNPKDGCYLNKDPIGLAGGINLYDYPCDPVHWVDQFGLARCSELDKKVAHIVEKYGGIKLENGGYKMPNKRSAKQAASEIAGNLGSNPQTVRRKDYIDSRNTHTQKKSNAVIGKISNDGTSGFYDHSIGHSFDDRSHINVWSKRFGATSKDNFHLYYETKK